LSDKPLLFTYTDNVQPHYGPKITYEVSPQVAKAGLTWRLSFDVAKKDVAISGGITLWDVCDIEFFEDGLVKAYGQGGSVVELARYAANKPLHFECLINVEAKTVAITVDGQKASTVTISWARPKASQFGCIILHGLLPGGHNEPSTMVFDNIKLVLEAMSKCDHRQLEDVDL